jgi:hypothetical protein
VVAHDERVVPEAALHRRGVLQRVRALEQLAAEQGEVAGGRDVRLLARPGRQAVDGMKLGVGHAQCLGLLVHQLDEPVLRAADVGRQRGGGVVGGLDHDRVEQVLHGEDLLLLEVDLRAADLRRLGGNGDRVVELDRALLDLLEDDEEVHQLDHAGGVALDVRLVLEQHVARRGVHGDRAEVGRGGLRGEFGRCEGRKREYEYEDDKAEFHQGTAPHGLVSVDSQRYVRVSATRTGLRTSRDIRFGTAIRAFVMSAKDQTEGRETTDPTMTAATHTQR